MNREPDQPPAAVLHHFASRTRGLAWSRAPAGFSGAAVWRGEENGSPRVALKAWPVGVSPGRVWQVHAWLVRAGALPFVPEVYPGAGGTVCVAAGRVWDCCEWKPGAPRLAPTPSEVEAACEAVARLHAALAPSAERGPIPGVRNRLRILAECEPLLRAGPGALPPVSTQLDPLLCRAASAAARLAPLATVALRPWAAREFPLQLCVRDLRAEHVLFEEGRVAGVIDFGAAAVDHPAADLARLLGDFGATGESLLGVGVAAYRLARGEHDVSEELVRLLARTGAVCSLLGWLVRLAVRREPVSDPAPIRARLSEIILRVEPISRFD